jgi:hypothetical protein
MTAVEVLAANGILRAGEVVELAAAARLELACACVLLVKESGGGRNVWGNDPVPTGGAYDKGGVVTRDNYTAYRRAVAEKRAGRKVRPLTSSPTGPSKIRPTPPAGAGTGGATSPSGSACSPG